MKCFYASLLASLSFGLAAAQAPASYYQSAAGLSGTQLQSALHTIIDNHTVLSYTPGLWNAYYTTDNRGNNKVWDIYSDIPGGTPSYLYTLGSSQCGNGANRENSCYNREHVWPQSKFNSASPMVSDLWIVYPTDYYVNNQRGNMPYGKVTSPSKTFLNGSKIGSNTYPGAPTGTCFEPIDSFKGDIARSYFYIATRYLGEDANWDDWEMATRAVLKPWTVQMLLSWHRMDPVSAKEISRNNAVYALQRNRNPYIDSPQYVECIWGTAATCRIPASVVTTGTNAPSIQVAYDLAGQRAYLTLSQAATIRLLDLQGRVLQTLTIPESGTATRWELPLSAYAPGIYLLQAQSTSGKAVQRLLIP
jgi:endonuclease I